MRSTRTKSLGVIALGVVVFGAYLTCYEPPYRGTLVTRPPRPLIFGHRGFGDHAPDNSLYAVERALDAGMDGVDVDGQLTRDSTLVIFHDLSVDRLTADTGRVRDKTLAAMLALDLGPKFHPPMHGAYVRTFEDFVRTVMARGSGGGGGILMVELKVPGMAATGIERRAVEIIQRYGAHERVVLSSFNPVVLYRVKRLDPIQHHGVEREPRAARRDQAGGRRESALAGAAGVHPARHSQDHPAGLAEHQSRGGRGSHEPADREGLARVHLDAGRGG